MKTGWRGRGDRVMAGLAIFLLCVLPGRAPAQGDVEADREAPGNLSTSQAYMPSAIFVPVILTATGRNNSFFTSELTLTNRGSEPAILNYTYTHHRGDKNYTATDMLGPLQQKIKSDAITYLRGLEAPIPETGSQIGTLRVDVTGSSEVAVVVRTTTAVPEGRAGLAYPGIPGHEGFQNEAVYLCGLRQNRQDRSNVALQNMGTEGEITLRTTVFSGEAADTGGRRLDDRTLKPGGFYQYNQVLKELGSQAQGYVKVERVDGEAPFYAYGVINDQATSDGSFVFPVSEDSLSEAMGQTLPVVIEVGPFTSELTVTNFSDEGRTVSFSVVADAIETEGGTATFVVPLEAGQQRIIPNAIDTARQQFGLNLPRGLAVPLFARAVGADMSGIVIGARTGSLADPEDVSRGQYSVFYTAMPRGAGFTGSAWVDGLQQNEENRSNLALVNTGEIDDSDIVFTLEIYDGETARLVNTVSNADTTVAAKRWHQINGILRKYGKGATQGFVRITKMSGNNPFLAYGVVNDGGIPRQRSDDGAYLPAVEERIHDPGTVSMADRRVLEALYQATGGPDWINRANWLSASPISDWFGVETDEYNRVTSLDLAKNRLIGRIPPELGQLGRLQMLNLGFNNLSGEIPPELGELIDLQVLDLYGNQLTGEIPTELAGLIDFQVLILKANQLSGEIPPELSELTDLQVLDLGINQLNGEIPVWLAGMTNLQRLDLSGNRLSGGIPPELGGMTSLQVLALQGNKLSGMIPPELGGLTNLQELDLQGNRLSGRIPPELGGMTNLQRLFLNGNELSGTIPAELAGLTHLQTLILWANKLSGRIPAELGALTQLEGLFLNFNRLSGTIPAELAGMTNLQWLDLEANDLSGTIPAELAGMTNLQKLSFGFNPQLGGTLPPGLQQLPLQTLDLMATSVCVSDDVGLQERLAMIEQFTSSGLTCGRPPAAMHSIDIAVFYTPAARRIVGGTAEMEAKIDLMIAETNQAYLVGGVNQRVVLVARKEVEYEEESGGIFALHRFSEPSDGYMDEVHAIRDRSGADVVHLIADVTHLAGQAYLRRAYALTCAECSSSTFAHEVGHNMGISHDRYVSAGQGLLSYSHGYVNQKAFARGAPESGRWLTIMAYPNQCSKAGFGCGEIMRFSNPNQSYLGDPLGVPGDERTRAVDGPADAVRTLNLTRHSVATFRPRASGNELTMSSTLSQAWPLARTTQAAVPAPGGSLFRAVEPNERGTTSQRAGGVLDRATLRRREVSVDIQTLALVADGEHTALRMNLFDDVVLMGIIERRTPTFSGGVALTGRLAGMPEGTVTLVVNGRVVAGTIRLPGATYRIRPSGEERQAIVQVDPSQHPQGCEVVTHRPDWER